MVACENCTKIRDSLMNDIIAMKRSVTNKYIGLGLKENSHYVNIYLSNIDDFIFKGDAMLARESLRDLKAYLTEHEMVMGDPTFFASEKSHISEFNLRLAEYENEMEHHNTPSI